MASVPLGQVRAFSQKSPSRISRQTIFCAGSMQMRRHRWQCCVEKASRCDDMQHEGRGHPGGTPGWRLPRSLRRCAARRPPLDPGPPPPPPPSPGCAACPRRSLCTASGRTGGSTAPDQPRRRPIPPARALHLLFISAASSAQGLCPVYAQANRNNAQSSTRVPRIEPHPGIQSQVPKARLKRCCNDTPWTRARVHPGSANIRVQAPP